MLAPSPKLDIFWSPSNRDNYIVFGSDITLHKVEKVDYRNSNSDPQLGLLTEDTYGKYLSHAESQFPKCMSWYPRADRDYLVAVGQANGSIAITSLDQKRNDDLIGKEFVPKHARPCCCVAWNCDPSGPPLLAAGLDKYRTDPSLLVWDVSRLLPDNSHTPDKHGAGSSYESPDITKLGKPMAECGNSEATYSLAWTSSNTIITGMNKYIRAVDVRDPSAFVKTTPTKAVYGVCIDPQNADCGIASYVENQVHLWDMRRFDKVVNTLPLQKSTIVKLAWCPKRLGLLACLSKESTAIRIFDIQQSSTSDFEYEQLFTERPVESPFGQQLASFDWHPFDENRLLIIHSNGTVRDEKFFERISLGMNPCGSDQQLCFSQVKKFGMFNFDNQEDVSSLMRQRAMRMYGLQKSHEERKLMFNMSNMQPHQPETELWNWVGHLSKLLETDESFAKVGTGASTGDMPLPYTRFVGARHITEKLNSIKSLVRWDGVGADNLSPLIHYQSEEREKCLKICEWPCQIFSKLGEDSRRSDPVTFVTTRLENEQQYEKATAIALFHGKINEALNILNRGSEYALQHRLSTGINLSIVAMALAGINNANNALWLPKCRELHNKIDNPYLRATFSFLTCGDNYDQILSNTDISVADRVAFACIFLSDSELRLYLSSLQTKVISNGNLSGILVTGLGEAGVELLQRYIDITCDIQTAALIIIHSFPSRMQEDERVKAWIEKAKFDIFHKEFVDKTNSSSVCQVYLSCNYCSKPIVPLQLQQRRMYNSGGYGQKPNTIKITVCNDCRKPLPRCALCLKNMGSSSGIVSAKQDALTSKSTDESGDSARERKKKMRPSAGGSMCAEFANWFTWCQTCHHGGHSIHIEDWFRRNIECPVSGCSCKCASLDSVPALKQ